MYKLKNKNIFFSGGAYGMIYYLGIISQIKPSKNTNAYGVSAGALCAMLFLLEYPMKKQIELYNELSNSALDSIYNRPFSLDSYDLTPMNISALQTIIQEYPDAYRRMNKRLHIGITEIDDCGNTHFLWKNTFRDNIELCNTLLCGFHLPILCTYNSQINSEPVMDGIISFDHTLHLPKDVFTIGITESSKMQDSETFHICKHISAYHCLFPISDYHRKNYYDCGKNDICVYMKNKNKDKNKKQSDCESSIPLFDDSIYVDPFISRVCKKCKTDILKKCLVFLRIIQIKTQDETEIIDKRALRKMIV